MASIVQDIAVILCIIARVWSTPINAAKIIQVCYTYACPSIKILRQAAKIAGVSCGMTITVQ